MWRCVFGLLCLVSVVVVGYLGARFLFGAGAAVFFTIMSTVASGVAYRAWAREKLRKRSDRAGDHASQV